LNQHKANLADNRKTLITSKDYYVDKGTHFTPVPYQKDTYKTAASLLRKKQWIQDEGLKLAAKSGQRFDEHGYNSGTYMNTSVLDFIPAREAKESPFFDMGGEGLAVVSVSRKTVYARSCTWRPSEASTHYLIGRNEAGTYFAHSVPKTCETVKQAVSWIWQGLEKSIICRQGDIALIKGNGPKNLNKLPAGHIVNGDYITHKTHPRIRLPRTGERIIIGRRAATLVSRNSRD
jgi:hypothetical protein